MKKLIYALTLLAFIFNSDPTFATSNTIKTPVQIRSQQSDTPFPIDNLNANFNNKIIVVFSDIDGTLIPFDKTKSDGIAPLSVNLAAKKLRDANIPMILVTGRSAGEAKEIAHSMGIYNSYIIAMQGAIIVNPKGEIIYQDLICPNDTKKIIKEAEEIIKKNHLSSKMFFFIDGKPYAKEALKMPYSWEKINVIKNISNDNAKKCSKIVIYDYSMENKKLIQAELKKKFPEYKIDISADCYCDISSPRTSKGNAINHLTQLLGVNLKNVAVFGDAENDISMLNLVKANNGLAVAVGNAMDNVKSNANFVTSSSSDNGFAKAVDKILKNNALLH